MAVTTNTRTNGSTVTLDVLRSPIAAAMIGAELTEQRARVLAEAGDAANSPIVKARVLGLDRTIAQLDRIASAPDQDTES